MHITFSVGLCNRSYSPNQNKIARTFISKKARNVQLRNVIIAKSPLNIGVICSEAGLCGDSNYSILIIDDNYFDNFILTITTK